MGAGAAERDLEAGLANLRAGNDRLATENLMLYYQRQTDPDIRRQIDLTLGQLNQPGQSRTRDERERAAHRLEDVLQTRTSGESRFALEWRFRNFPVFP